MKFICVNSVNNRKIGIYNLPRKEINKDVYALINKCSNPLHYHKESCIVLWTHVDKFNESIDQIKYEINHLKTEDNTMHGLYDCVENNNFFYDNEFLSND